MERHSLSQSLSAHKRIAEKCLQIRLQIPENKNASPEGLA